MPGRTDQIASREGGRFACHVSCPDGAGPTPAVVLASSILGVDEDLRAMADAFAARGYIAAAPDLFWRTLPGPLRRGDPRAARRAEPRLSRIASGEADMADALAHLRGVPGFNGKALAMGLCYGGPYAVIGPARLGFSAGIACHGSQMLPYAREAENLRAPVVLLWGDRDDHAPPAVIDAYQSLARTRDALDVRIFPAVGHGYMMPGNAAAFSPEASTASLSMALHLLAALRGESGPSARPAGS